MKANSFALIVVSLLIAGCSNSTTPTATPGGENSDDPPGSMSAAAMGDGASVLGGGGGSDPASIFSAQDKDGNGKLEGDEINEWMRGNLATIDTDSDQAITLDEYQNSMQSMMLMSGGGPGGGGGGPGGGGFDSASMFARDDADGDGKLTGDEISDFIRGNMEETDTDGDGAISLQEFQGRLNALRSEGSGGPGPGGGGGGGGGGRGGAGGGGRGGGGGFDPAAIFERRDEDGDGKLTGDEISDFMRNNMEGTDTDGDGAITLEEFQKRLEEMRSSGGFGGGGGGRPGGFGGNPREGRPERDKRPETEE